MNYSYQLLLFVLTLACAVGAVMARNLLTGAILLGLVSIGASLIIFDFGAPWAGVFELSVCAGLITVLFISAVSLVRGSKDADADGRVKFLALPLALAAAGIAFWFIVPDLVELMSSCSATAYGADSSLGKTLWALRSQDLLAQVAMLAAGVFVIKSIFPSRRKTR